MSAVLLVASSFALGLFLGALVSAARDYVVEQADDDAYPDDLVRAWREGHAQGELKGIVVGRAEGHSVAEPKGYADGYADGYTIGRADLRAEMEAKRHHPTGSPLSELKAIDAEADDRMRGLD